MSKVIHFVPLHERDVRKNLEQFIDVYRNKLTVFDADLDWESNAWPEAGVSFGNLDQKTRVLRDQNVMQLPFREFAFSRIAVASIFRTIVVDVDLFDAC